MRIAQSLTLASTATSGVIDCTDGLQLLGIETPSSMASTTLTFTGSHDGTTYNVVKDVGGGAYSVTVGTSRYIPFDPRIFAGLNYVKLVFGSSESATFNAIKGNVG